VGSGELPGMDVSGFLMLPKWLSFKGLPRIR
jgi:hypothetical protein